MLAFYWGLLLTGALFALVTVVFGDLLSNALDGLLDFLSGDWLQWLQPMVIFSAIATLGGAGILLTEYTGLSAATVFVLSLLISIAVAVPVYLFYVRPMDNSENSVAFSIRDLVGRIGEVSVPIPVGGCGEVLVRTTGGLTNQIAESFDGESIESGARVVAVDVRDGVLLVSRLDS
ncbi:hypothetical protein [Paenibacillus ginsengihumi]|jgi:membrane protein implicated in regulation of membrane protease activity|uniref:hypothetical protein n=1 Tax=Paenibacillus ginsengihumi TaxID=431596 RepID=UPI00037473F9|nr:hypothetical protein [Paenibacillus ginsengihumi]